MDNNKAGGGGGFFLFLLKNFNSTTKSFLVNVFEEGNKEQTSYTHSLARNAGAHRTLRKRAAFISGKCFPSSVGRYLSKLPQLLLELEAENRSRRSFPLLDKDAFTEAAAKSRLNQGPPQFFLS